MISLPIADIIRDAFKLAWKHKYLWVFGLFAAGNTSFNLPIDQGQSSLGNYEAAYDWLMAALVAVILIGLAVAVIALILHVISKSALIYNVYQIETDGVHGLGAGWDFGLKRFWPMLGLTLLLVMVILAFMLLVVAFVAIGFAIATALGFLALLIAIPVFILGLVLIILTGTYAERFVTLEMRGIVQAIGDGWNLWRTQWKPSVLMLLVKIAIAIALGIGVMGVGAALALPAVPLWFVSPVLAILYGVIVLLPFMVLAGSYFGTFDSAVWTKTFLLLRADAYAVAAGGHAQPNSPPSPPPDESRPPSPPMFE